LKAIDQSWLNSTNQGLPINVEDIIITTGGSEAFFAMGARWILEMKSSSQNHFTQITMVFLLHLS
jgi:hypothetical protein